MLSKQPQTGRRALVVQGGGMRGVYSMAALAALDEAGYRNAFDVIAGSSAGAINAAYFLAGQADDAVHLYIDYLSNRKFVNFVRVKKIVDIDYLVDVALREYLPLDIDALRETATLLEIMVTDAETGELKVLANRDEEYDFYDTIYEIIRATAALPGLYNKKVPVGSGVYVDGGATDSLPLIRTLNLYHPELVLAIVTRQAGYRTVDHSVFYRMVAKAIARGQSQAIKERLGCVDSTFNLAMDTLAKKRANSTRVFGVFPSDASKLASRTTFDRSKLSECAKMGRQDMQDALSAIV